MEYYSLRNPDESISKKQNNNFSPKQPFRLVIAGTSESGKTEMVVYLLLGSKYSKIYPIMLGEKDNIRKFFMSEVFGTNNLRKYYVYVGAKDKETPWSGRHNNISSIFIGQRYFEINQNIRGNETHISVHHWFGTLDSLKRVLKDMYDDYESLAKKVYEVIKKHYVIIDIRRPADDPLSIRYRWDKLLLK
ncbi:hypothetical protein Glove_645g45 [Diversispora epigaea]|uniref:Uncharacterized protein n=1 Tax=Diversispora epigaea TaxID=1348612 RepID=A0A397G4F9_9GLOM|nr:hypothetical protein Glove_645g43 [Diversispora epigaea]RHZ45855.1 hypothetical protein Glove_645g45 [Diversispora epigaea]